MSTAFLFSGQGSEYVGMGKELYDNFPECRYVFDAADFSLGFKLSELMFSGSEKTLNKIEFTHPAVLTHSLAALELISSRVTPSYALGISLGEYSALAAAGSMPIYTAFEIVHARSRFLSTSAETERESAMTAVLNLPIELIEQACEEASDVGIIQITNINSPDQIVIGGTLMALEYAEKLCAKYGARKCIRLSAPCAFHTKLMQTAGDRLNAYLTTLQKEKPFENPKFKVISNLTAKPIEKTTDIVPTLTKQITSTVLIEDSIRYLLAEGVDTFVELGPGTVLSSIVSKIMPSGIKILNIDDAKSYYKTIEALS